MTVSMTGTTILCRDSWDDLVAASMWFLTSSSQICRSNDRRPSKVFFWQKKYYHIWSYHTTFRQYIYFHAFHSTSSNLYHIDTETMKHFLIISLAICVTISVVLACCTFVAAAENTLRGSIGDEINEKQESSSPDQQRRLFSLFGHEFFGPRVSTCSISNGRYCNPTF